MTGRTGEVLEALSDRKLTWHAFKKHDGKVVVTSSRAVWYYVFW